MEEATVFKIAHLCLFINSWTYQYALIPFLVSWPARWVARTHVCSRHCPGPDVLCSVRWGGPSDAPARWGPMGMLLTLVSGDVAHEDDGKQMPPAPWRRLQLACSELRFPQQMRRQPHV